MMVTRAGANPGVPLMEQAADIRDAVLEEEQETLHLIEGYEQDLHDRIRERLGYAGAELPSDTGLIDTRVEKDLIIKPEALIVALPLTEGTIRTTSAAREAGERILAREDDRVMFMTGPCSISDPEAAIEFAERFVLPWRERYAEDLEVGMRYYDEKPRTGPKKGKQESWKGIAFDPTLDREDDINLGFVLSRLIVSRITDAGIPVAKERLNTITPQYQNGMVAHDVIGARNTSDPKMREYAAGTSSLIAFKNTLDGDIEAAVAAASGAGHAHTFAGIETSGRLNRIEAKGNKAAYIILRGSVEGPNCTPEHIEEAKRLIEEYGIDESIGVDFSHMNSGKKAERQIEAARMTTEQIAAGEQAIRSVWTESNLVAGRQDIGPRETLVHGQSITDECIDPEETEEILEMTASAVRQRRKVGKDLTPAE